MVVLEVRDPDLLLGGRVQTVCARVRRDGPIRAIPIMDSTTKLTIVAFVRTL